MLLYSVIIPIFNSEKIITDTVDHTVKFFTKNKLNYEIILVNDCSKDNSWRKIANLASTNSKITAIDLLRNYGQNTAIFCGFQFASGNYIITIDDDMQNPPEEIIHLINKAKEGYDLVIGQFIKKKHAFYRRLGSIIIGYVNRRIFMQHYGLILSNFRIIRRDVVDRICKYKTAYPYITGLVLMFSSNPANAMVQHNERPVGKSNYSIKKIIRLVYRILFNYSSFPLRVVVFLGGFISITSFLLGSFYIIRNIYGNISVPGWTTLVVLLSFFNGIVLLMLGMLGEYLIRLINSSSYESSFNIKTIINSK